MSADQAVEVRCDLCGELCTEVDGGQGFLHLELTAEQAVDGVHWWSADFCSQAHATEWLARPLPDPARPGGGPGPLSWQDRLFGVVAVGAVVGWLALTALGAWTVVRFVLDLF